MPWVYVRRQIAERWHVPPWIVDGAPFDEIDLELQILGIEEQARVKAEQVRAARDGARRG